MNGDVIAKLREGGAGEHTPDPLKEVRSALQDVAGAGADSATAYECGHGRRDNLVRGAIEDALAAITRYGDARAKSAVAGVLDEALNSGDGSYRP